MQIFYVAIGGALGSVLRYLIMSWVGQLSNNTFPFATFIINVTGSFIMGLLIGWLARTLPENAAFIRLFVAVGVLGGYTTFSTFSLDAIVLMESGKWLQMAVYIALSVILSLAGLLAGLVIIRNVL